MAFCKKLFYVFVITAISSCISTKFESERSNSKKEFEKIIYSFISKTPNELYGAIGKPQKNEVKLDKNGNITNAVLSYQYVYNFNTKKYDCEIYFITNQKQNMIVDAKYNSNKCLYLTMY